MKKYADKKRYFAFEVGEWVFIKLRPRRQQTVAQRINQKLALRIFGPFPIVGNIWIMSYKLQLPNTTKIHFVFHISQLKKFVEDYATKSSLLAELEKELDEIEEPKAFLVTSGRPLG